MTIIIFSFVSFLTFWQGWLDYVNQRLLAWPPCWLLPLFSHHPTVHRSRIGHGGFRQSPSGTEGPEYLRLDPLVPQDEGLRLHVHGICSPEGQRHHQLLELHILHNSHHCCCMYRSRTNDERREKEREEGTRWRREAGCGKREGWVKLMCDVMIVLITGELVCLQKKKKKIPTCTVIAINCHLTVFGFWFFFFLKTNNNTERRVMYEHKDIQLYHINSENSFQIFPLCYVIICFIITYIEKCFFLLSGEKQCNLFDSSWPGQYC